MPACSGGATPSSACLCIGGGYSVPAGTYRGKQIPGIGEWIMHDAKIPAAEYKE